MGTLWGGRERPNDQSNVPRRWVLVYLVSGDWLLAMDRMRIGGEKANFWQKKFGDQWERVKASKSETPTL